MEDSEVSIRIELKSGRRFPLVVAFSHSATCNDILDTIKSCLFEIDMTSYGSQWILMECWHGINKRLNGRDSFQNVMNSWADSTSVAFVAREKRHQKKQEKRKRKMSQKQAQPSSKSIQREIKETKREVDRLNLLLLKRDRLSSDPIRDTIQMMSALSDKVDGLRSKKEQLAREVFNMNHEAARLTEQLTFLRRSSQTASDSLTQAKEAREERRRKTEKETREGLEELNEAISATQLELERRQFMSELQDNKIYILQEEISSLQSSLSQREKEKDKMKQWVGNGTVKEVFAPPGIPQSIPGEIKREREGGDSFKRRFVLLNKKTKQQVEEEARAFREAAMKPQDVDSPMSPQADFPFSLSQKRRMSKDEKKEKKGILVRNAKEKDEKKASGRVYFDATALLLNAAGEGDMELIKQCIRKLGGCQVFSSKGATCLHNAVCSGNLSIMEYFIELGCDVNAQDCEGWTPLHCAAGFTHLPAMHLLLQNGASLYLQTSDEQYPIDLVREASECDNDDIDALNCYQYLRDCWQGLGKIKERKVYALFSYVATSNEELSFMSGEEMIVMHREEDLGWWIVENGQGMKGFVPSTFFGLYPRRQIVL